MLITTPCVVHEQGWANSFARLSVCQSVCFKSNFKQVRQGIYKLDTEHIQSSRQFFCQLLPAITHSKKPECVHGIYLHHTLFVASFQDHVLKLHNANLKGVEPVNWWQEAVGAIMSACFLFCLLEVAGKRTALIIVYVEYKVCKCLA